MSSVVKCDDGILTVVGKGSANAKLILNRIVGATKADDKIIAAAKRAWIAKRAKDGDVELRANLLLRRRAVVAALAAQGTATTEVKLQVLTPLAIGHSGAGSTNDNSLTLHGISGDPFLPATALKGVTRSHGPDDPDLFGTASQDNARGTIGSVTFLPALAESTLTLQAAVLTPHAGDYYTSNGAKPASGHQSPVPVEFLTVRSGVFVGHILGPALAVAEARRRLIEAVDELGIGAKTAAGFGYLKEKT
jgi:CRISPR/Cas system CMR subunit Cmr6 (Cas7 group RAMP superfamily)